MQMVHFSLGKPRVYQCIYILKVFILKYSTNYEINQQMQS